MMVRHVTLVKPKLRRINDALVPEILRGFIGDRIQHSEVKLAVRPCQRVRAIKHTLSTVDEVKRRLVIGVQFQPINVLPSRVHRHLNDQRVWILASLHGMRIQSFTLPIYRTINSSVR